MKAHELRARRVKRAGPAWIWGQDALERSAAELSRMPGPFLLVGEARLLGPSRKRLSQAWIEEGIEIQPFSFPEGGECTEAQARALASAAAAKKSASLIAWGGGKCLDSVKWAGQMAGLPVLTVPTSAATCACATQVVVAHGEGGEVLDLVDLDAPPVLCVADFDLLRSAPALTLSAGLGDTLAKWMEWSAIEEPLGDGALSAGRARDLVMDASTTPELLWEACLRLSAEASNLGQAPAAAAHSFCAGISLLPASRAVLHGAWAGLGLLFQERLLGRGGENLEAWLASRGLPTRIPFALDPSDLRRVEARILMEGESIHQMPALDPSLVPGALASLLP